MSSTFPRLATSPLDTIANQLEVLLVGPWNANEFNRVLSDVPEAKTWHAAEGISEACAALDESATPPELVVLAKPLPGHYRQEEINHLQRLAPLTRIVVVAGTWCEGEMRTGEPLSGALRLYWHEFVPWWKAAKYKLAEGQCPPWSLPLDTPGAGRFQVEQTVSGMHTERTIAISTDDYAVYETLTTALSDYGMATQWVQGRLESETVDQCAGGIWDGGQLSPQELQELTWFCGKIGDRTATVVALLDFPRAEHALQVQSAGAQAVFGKPYVVAEIAEMLR